MPRLRAPALLFALLACQSAPRPVLPGIARQPRSNVEARSTYVQALREEMNALGRIQSVRLWYTATQGETPIEGLTWLGHDRLFRRTALEAVDGAQQAPGLAPAEALALRFFRRTLSGQVVQLATARFADQFRAAEDGATVRLPFRDQPVAYNDLQNLIAQEADPERRAQAFAAQNAVRVGQLNPILERKEAAAQEAARQTGFADYVALSEDQRDVHLDALLAAGVVYLQATDALFEKTLDRVSREELGVGREALRVTDLARIWKAPRLAAFFDQALELKALRAFLRGIGLDLRTAGGAEIRIDDALTAKKRPRAFVDPVNPPDDVRLSVKPTGGLDDYQTLFHEAGHAVHFAYATARPVELVSQGYLAPSEAFGEFFRHAFSDPRWLFRYREFLRAQGKPVPSNVELAAIERLLALREMEFLRRYAFAKIAYELRLHGRPVEEIAPALALLEDPERAKGDLRELYRQLFSRADGFSLSEAESQAYRTDVDETFYAADYSRAFVLGGMMHDAVRRRFGEDWYANPEVGAFLRQQLFAPGTSLSSEDVAERLGFPRMLDFAAAAVRAARLCAEADALEKAK